MIHHLTNLLGLATRIEEHGSDLSYIERVNIERPLFIISKGLADKFLDYVLGNFTVGSRTDVESCRGQPDTNEKALHVVLKAFELRAVLQKLAAGHSYLSYDVHDLLPKGRAQAVRLFGKQLKAFAESAIALFESTA